MLVSFGIAVGRSVVGCLPKKIALGHALGQDELYRRSAASEYHSIYREVGSRMQVRES
jgi:hypothetical protein